MIGNRWFHEPDDERESWCFLSLEQKSSGEEPITGWRMGYGNPTKIVRTVESEGSREDEVIQELLGELHYCRRNDIILVTSGSDVVRKLRTRILMSNVQGASFRGVRHISIENSLKEYFAGISSITDLGGLSGCFDFGDWDKSKIPGHEDPAFLWEIFLKIGPLLPKECFREKLLSL